MLAAAVAIGTLSVNRLLQAHLQSRHGGRKGNSTVNNHTKGASFVLVLSH